MHRTIAFATALMLAGPVLAQETPAEESKVLNVGDPAPEIDIAHWLKGEKVEAFENDKVYVIEFWATWCGPCIYGMPHLSELQEKYKDYGVSVIGISDEPLQKVFAFMFTEYNDGKIQNDRTNYTLTTDPDRSVFNDYFKAAGRTGIPSALVVGKDQRIEWIGHPSAGLDEALGEIVRDEWDREAFGVKYAKDAAIARERQAKRRAMMEARRAGDWDKALELLDEMIESTDDGAMKVDKFVIIGTKMNDYDRAYAFIDGVIDDHWGTAQLLNQIAWYIVDLPQLERRDTVVAMKAATRANELTEGKDPAVLDTVARVHFVKGELEMAIKYQRQAMELANENLRGEIEERLKEYEAALGDR